MSRGSSQVVWVSWYNSSVGIGGQASYRCDSWDVMETISVSKTISISITVSFTLSNVVSIWPSSVSSISDMGDSDVLEDWSSFGSKMGSGGGSNSWGVSWDYSAVSISGESSNRGDWSSSEDVDGWISFTVGFTLANVVVSSVWESSISEISGVESWGSSGSKMG